MFDHDDTDCDERCARAWDAASSGGEVVRRDHDDRDHDDRDIDGRGPDDRDLDDASWNFWGDAPDWPTGELPPVRPGGRVRRVRVELEPRPTRVRRHHHTGHDDAERPAASPVLGSVDPFLLRIGALVAAAVLLVPVLLSLRSAPEPSVATVVGASAASDQPAAGEVTAGELPAQPAAVTPASPGPSAATGSEPSVTTPASPAQQPEAEAPTATPSAPAVTSAEPAPTTTVAPATGVVDAAEADEPAERVEVPCQLTYTAAAGDYWLRLADAAGVSLADLLDANDASTSTPIYPGDELCLPAGATVPSPPTTTPPAAPPSTAPVQLAPPTTAAAPSTTAPPTTAVPDAATVQGIIREVWPDDLEERALEVARRESTFKPTAKNWCCYGLFQIYWEVHRGWLDDLGITSATQLFDARTNATAAYHLYLRSGGWGPWGG